MIKYKIILSGGTVLWMNLKQSLKLVRDMDYDGLEILPTRRIISNIKSFDLQNYSFIESIHQNWRFDNKKDKQYGISFLQGIFFRIIRYIFFPSIDDSSKAIDLLISKTKIPIVVHDILPEWTMNSKNEIQLEIFRNNIKKETLRKWLKLRNNFVVMDTRDDQSLIWAKNNEFINWRQFWEWVGLEKIKSVQLTFIGTGGIRRILKHKYILAENQLIFLHQNNWSGSVVVEINPISLLLNAVGIKKGLKIIKQFVETTLEKGQKWS